MTRKYSHRLGVLSRDQFQEVLDRFSLGELVRAEPVPFGNFGQNVFLTSTKGEYVLRGAPHYPWQFPKERFFTDLLHEHTSVPVPWPYRLDPSDDIFGWSYVIMPRMPGLQLSKSDVRDKLGAEDRLGIAYAMGETLALLQELTWPCAGEYDLESDTIQPLEVDYSEWVISRIHHYLQLAMLPSDRTTDADVKWVEMMISLGRKALDVPFQPCFVMQDYKRNVEKFVPEGPRIKFGSGIAVNVTLLPGAVIGRECIIGASSLVTKDVPDFSIAFGVPAKAVKTVDEKWRLPEELYQEFRKRVSEEYLMKFLDRVLSDYK